MITKNYSLTNEWEMKKLEVPVDLTPALRPFERKTDVVYYYGLASGWGMAGSASPFCTKFELYLRMRKIPHEVRTDSFRPGPKGKLPWMEFNTFTVADSAWMLEFLDRYFAPTGEQPVVDPREEAAVQAVCSMLEFSTYFQLLYFRWVDDRAWAQASQEYFRSMNWLMRQTVPFLARRQVVGTAHAQGISRHSRVIVIRMFTQDISVVARILGDRPYMLGNHPSIYDCIVFGFLSCFLAPVPDTPLQAITLKHDNLAQYYERMRSQYYPEATPLADVPRVIDFVH